MEGAWYWALMHVQQAHPTGDAKVLAIELAVLASMYIVVPILSIKFGR